MSARQAPVASQAIATLSLRVTFFAFWGLQPGAGLFLITRFPPEKRKPRPGGWLVRLVKYKGSHPAGARPARRRDGGTQDGAPERQTDLYDCCIRNSFENWLELQTLFYRRPHFTL